MGAMNRPLRRLRRSILEKFIIWPLRLFYFPLFIQPEGKMHAAIVSHTLLHFNVFIEMLTQIDQLQRLFPYKPLVRKIIQK